MHGVVTIGDWDEEVKDVPFVFLIALWPLTLLFPRSIPPVCVLLPVLVGSFQVSRTCLMFCQIFSSLSEYFKLFLIVAADLLIFSCNSCQSLCDEEEFLSCGCPMSLKSGTHWVGGELQLTELCRDSCDCCRNGEGLLSVNHWGFSWGSNWEWFGSVHVDSEAWRDRRGDVCRVGWRHVVERDWMLVLNRVCHWFLFLSSSFAYFVW